MKIIAELIRVRQEWDPNTNSHTNSVIFAFGGVQVEVPASPEQVKAIIIQANEQRSWAVAEARPLTTALEAAAPQRPWDNTEVDESAGGSELDAALDAEMTDDDTDAEFGGDFVQNPDEPVAAPALFQTPAVAPSLDAALEGSQSPAPPLSSTKQREALVEARRAQDPAQQRKDERAAMRQRAAAVPRRKVTVDEAGNPVPYVDRGAHIVGPVGHPEVRVQQQAPTVSTGGDDDRFGQG